MSNITNSIRPRFRGRIVSRESGVILENSDGKKFMPRDVDEQTLCSLSVSMNGTRSIEELADTLPPNLRSDCGAIVAAMDECELIDDNSIPDAVSGLEFLFELEELTARLASETIYKNPFWRACLNANTIDDVPQNVVYGMVIENWQFLVRESYFDAPVLSFVPSRQVRLAMNSFFSEEYGHDEILFRSLQAIGVTREDLEDSIPLPETLGLCNALAFWSLNDPLFFFTTLGLLEGQGLKVDSFIEACQRMGFAEAFVEPLRIHSNININAGHGNLTRLIFSHIEAIDRGTRARLRAQTHLFVELYNAFYNGVWRHYSQSPTLLRRVSEL